MSENFANLSENNFPIYYTNPPYQCLKVFAYSVHCSNPEVRIRKKMQPRFEAAVRTLMKRASKRAPT